MAPTWPKVIQHCTNCGAVTELGARFPGQCPVGAHRHAVEKLQVAPTHPQPEGIR